MDALSFDLQEALLLTNTSHLLISLSSLLVHLLNLMLSVPFMSLLSNNSPSFVLRKN
jgi:hypothetical protein